MSGFWSGWVIFFVALNMLLVIFLLIFALRVRIPVAEDGTTGHVWAHGALREAVRRLPLWWVLMAVGLIVFSVVYLVLYPGLGSYAGTLGWSSAEQVRQEQVRNQAKLADLHELVRTQPVAELAQDPRVVRAGGVLYDENCAACHGPGGEGNTVIGAPDLTDDAWLYGGGEDAIRSSIVAGRAGQMPGFGNALGEQGVREVATFVYTLNGRDWPRPDLVRAGAERYQQLCVACHGPEGRGNPAMGAPDLTDESWLYGARRADIEVAVRNGRSGVMPGWEERLGAEDIEMLIAWIRAAGEGEEAP